MSNVNDKAMVLYRALGNAYMDEENRSYDTKLNFNEEHFEEDITAMLLAAYMIFTRLTKIEMDILEFTHVLNKLAVQNILEIQESEVQR